jgi:hypothetical protein
MPGYGQQMPNNGQFGGQQMPQMPGNHR